MRATLTDHEFGAIGLHRSHLSRSVRLKLSAHGVISISLPPRAPVRAARQLLEESRDQLRQLIRSTRKELPHYQTGDMIGTTHRLRLEHTESTPYTHTLTASELIVHLPVKPDARLTEKALRTGIGQVLREQARGYLPLRLEQLASMYGLYYDRLRLSSPSTRWGSCSARGTISLNVWLMQLPRELIDYVLIHELCHTKHLNHSRAFLGLVETCCPGYRTHRRELRRFSPQVGTIA